MRACKTMSLDTSEQLLLVYVDEDKASSTASAWRLNGAFAHVR